MAWVFIALVVVLILFYGLMVVVKAVGDDDLNGPTSGFASEPSLDPYDVNERLEDAFDQYRDEGISISEYADIVEDEKLAIQVALEERGLDEDERLDLREALKECGWRLRWIRKQQEQSPPKD